MHQPRYPNEPVITPVPFLIAFRRKRLATTIASQRTRVKRKMFAPKFLSCQLVGFSLSYPRASSKSLSVSRSLFIWRLPAASKSGPVSLKKAPGWASTLCVKCVPSSVGSKV